MEEEEQKETKDASKADKNKTTDASASFVQNTEATNSFTSISTSPPSPSSSASKRASPANEVPKYPRIVTLPCSHVFHAECLIPWFTRPRQTTCPTCRFNIDPDDLTRGIGTRRRAAAPAAAGGRGGSDVALSEDTIPPFTVMDEIGTINPVTGPPIPLDGVPFVGSVNGGGDGNSTFVPFQPGIISAGNRES
ncbi:hypothetical protein J3R30DRAFT_1107242 [Lentinula aciculospora]|uniref:RING-type domain-containing protein n=1 Tax=Lentinula aciculospora TaxID=153920 RepID=A0A9W8ZZU0_9AGAR|nr:hypothetical protein J3R30DRAFT_1107242 [Lentinula aciculospora]